MLHDERFMEFDCQPLNHYHKPAPRREPDQHQLRDRSQWSWQSWPSWILPTWSWSCRNEQIRWSISRGHKGTHRNKKKLGQDRIWPPLYDYMGLKIIRAIRYFILKTSQQYPIMVYYLLQHNKHEGPPLLTYGSRFGQHTMAKHEWCLNLADQGADLMERSQ